MSHPLKQKDSTLSSSTYNYSQINENLYFSVKTNKLTNVN
jgi:hypothetical protein